MKKNFLIVFVLLSSYSYSQYIPFPTNYSVWTSTNGNIMSGSYDGQFFSLFLHGDTIISGKTYSKLCFTNDLVDINHALTDSIFGSTYHYDCSVFVCGIREDSTKKIWYSGLRNFNGYCYYTTLEGDTNEYLLYDFGMHIGDTLVYYNQYLTPFYPSPRNVVLQDTSSVYFANNWRKVYHYSYFGIFNSEVLEGMGSVEGILAPLMNDFEQFNEMLCYNGYENIYSSFCNGSCPCNMYLNISENSNVSVNENLFYPNPTTGFININKLGGNIIILSTSGQIVFKQDQLDSAILDLSQFENGIYIIKFIKNGRTSFEKLVICK